MIHNNIFAAIGNTPLIFLERYSTPAVRIYAKLEGANPGGSIKDRIAKYLILEAEAKGQLNKDKTIIESTSGNTGIGLAMFAAVRGYKFSAVMSDKASIERRKLIKAYGAGVLLVDTGKGKTAVEVAREVVAAEPEKYIMLDQYRNPANVAAHRETTGPEIYRDLPEVDYFVAGMGTGGTLIGVGSYLKLQRTEIQIVGVEPDVNSKKIQGLRNMQAYQPEIFDLKLLDRKLTITDEPAFKLARDLFKVSGLSVGISSGAALWGAMQIRDRIKKGIIVTIFPDRGDRYLSTELFA